MAKFSTPDKINRTLTLLVGLRRQAVLTRLAPHGLRLADVEEGKRLFDQVLIEQSNVPLREPWDAGLVGEIDAFESLWLGLAETKLKRRFPAIAEALTAHVDRSKPYWAFWNVPRFLERLADMECGQQPFGSDGPAARQLLAELGLTEAEVARGRALCEQINQFESEGPSLRTDAKARDAAIAAMWDWTVEWSAVARKFINEGYVLRSLGLGKRGRKEGAEVEQAESPLQWTSPATGLLAVAPSDSLQKAG